MSVVIGAAAMPRGPARIAHRCGAGFGPENTLAAWALAMRAGFDALEVDVKLSADGVPFLMHDDDLSRTTDGMGRASRLPWRELARLDAGAWFDPAFRGTPVARLDQLAASAPAAWINLEIKPDGDADTARQIAWGAAIATAAARLWHGAARPPLLSSFSLPALQGAARAAPELARAWVCHRLPPAWRGIAQSLRLEAIHLDAASCQPDIVEAFSCARIRLRLFTLEDEAAINAWLARGADGVFTDGRPAYACGRRTPV